jgi:hypothetical protein
MMRERRIDLVEGFPERPELYRPMRRPAARTVDRHGDDSMGEQATARTSDVGHRAS